MNSQVADLVGDRDGGRASTPRSHPYPFPLPRITTAAKKPLTVEEADSFTSSQAGIQGRVTIKSFRARFDFMAPRCGQAIVRLDRSGGSRAPALPQMPSVSRLVARSTTF